MKQAEINDFKRKYFDLKQRCIPNAIIHDPNTCREHRHVVNEVCEWLRETKRTFYTRVYTNYGEIIDIVCPELPYPFIEVRHSEKDKVKEYDSEYDHLRIFVDTDDPYKLL
jgi:hypothetical protein